ncbi:MAG: tetratricopeptide repeat protein [Candidatus Gastranaerophilales bacterium]|nr:tetratricopeptide repeat protein [Candidatus Gastranaerophilales bacterium]
MKKFILSLLKILCILGFAALIIFKYNWIQIHIINRCEGMFYVYKGDRAYHKYKLSYAIQYYQRGLALYPKHYSAWYNLGNIFVVYEDYFSAVEAYEEAIKHNKKYVVARMNLGIIQAEKLGNFDAAIEQYDAIINTKYRLWFIPFIFSNKKSSKINKGLAYYNRGRAYREKATYLPDEQRNLTTMLLLKSADSYEKACKILKKNSDARYNLALVYHLLGNYRDAGKNYCKAIELAPMNYEAHYNLAILLRRMKRFKASLEELEKASLLISTSGTSVNAEYIFGILADVSRSYVDYKYDPMYIKYYENDTDNQEVTVDKQKKHRRNKKNKDDSIDSYVDEKGKIKSTSELDKGIMKNMSRCAGYSYFRNESNEY